MDREGNSRDLLGVIIGSSVLLGGAGLAVTTIFEAAQYYFSENRGAVQISSIQESRDTGGIYTPNLKRHALVSGTCFFVGGLAGGLYEGYMHRRRSTSIRTNREKVALAP